MMGTFYADMEKIRRKANKAMRSGKSAPLIVESLVSFSDRARKRRKGYTPHHDARALAGVFTAQATGIGSSATSIRHHDLILGVESPARATVYRNFQGLKETEATHIGTEIRGIIASLHSGKLNHAPGLVVADEWDEISTSRNRFTSSRPATESGNRIKFTKAALKRAANAKAAGLEFAFDPFKDATSFGHEHDRLIVVLEDGTRAALHSQIPREGNNVSPHSLLEGFYEILRQRHGDGMRFRGGVYDARWDGLPSILVCRRNQDLMPWTIRHKEYGKERDAVPTRAARVMRKRRESSGWIPSKRLARETWQEKFRMPGRPNYFLAFREGAVFRGDPGKSTRVIVWRLKRGHQPKPGEKLTPWRNLFPMYLTTSHPPTREGAIQAATDFFDRWDVEEDVKHHKRYRKKGGGQQMHKRALLLQASEIVKAIVHLVHKFAFHWSGKKVVQFQDLYNAVAREIATLLNLSALSRLIEGQLSTPP